MFSPLRVVFSSLGGQILTECLHKRGALSSTLMDQWIHNPTVTPSSCPVKFWGLFGEVAHIVHLTPQSFMIGQWSFFVGQDVHGNISTKLYLHMTKFQPLTLIHMHIH